MVENPQVVSEEKELVFLNGAAHIATQVVVRKMANGGIEKVARIEVTVPDEFVGSAVKLVRAGLKDDVGNASRSAAQFGIVVTCGYVYRRNGFERRHQDLQKAGTLIVVDAFDLIVVALAQLAIDFSLQRATGVEELGVLEGGPSCTGHEVQKVLEIAIGAEWQVLRQHRFELASCVRPLRLEDWYFRLHVDRFQDVPGLKHKVDALGRVHDHIDARA